MIHYLKNQWFLISLAFVLLVGFYLCRWLEPLTTWESFRNCVLFAVLFLMALPVPTSELGKALRSPWAALYASSINFLAIPLMAWAGAGWFGTFLGEGLIVAAVVPCTLASAAVWTRRAGGNDSVAIFVTLFTNLSCFVLTPFWIWLTLGAVAEISAINLMWKLLFLVVLPILLAQAVRQHRGFGSWSTRRKIELSVAAQVGILMMVMIGAAKMGLKLDEDSTIISWTSVVKVLLMVNAIHLFALFFGKWSARLLGFNSRDQIAVGIAGSQKTLMVGLNTAVDLERSILPMLLYHICQLFFDTIIADRWRKKIELENPESETQTQNASKT